MIVLVDMAVWETEKGTFLRVLVKPRSKEKKLVAQFSDEQIIINLSSPAREGKANTELVKKLCKSLKLSTTAVTIVAGQKSREKTLLINGLKADDLKQMLELISKSKQ